MGFEGEVAFIAGAASGVGLALAEACAARGMRVVMTDIETTSLEKAAKHVATLGGDVFPMTLDVSDDRAQYESVARTVLERFGPPFALFNNAGVAWSTPAATATIEEWTWLVQVNIMGLANGLTLFVPAMIKQARGHVINTGSASGLTTCPGAPAVYSMTKHAVVAISEDLAHELRPHGIHVAVICPGVVATSITDSDRNKPGGALGRGITEISPETREAGRAFLANGLPPSEVARQTLAAMEDRRFYVMTHPEYRTEIEWRFHQILQAASGEPATDAALIAASGAAATCIPLT